MNARNTFLVLAAALLVAACGSGPDLVAPEAGPRFGIGTMGSGNNSDSTTVSSTTESDSTETTRGIWTIGSGN